MTPVYVFSCSLIVLTSVKDSLISVEFVQISMNEIEENNGTQRYSFHINLLFKTLHIQLIDTVQLTHFSVQ